MVVFDEIEHRYSVGARELPSVTQILKATGLYEARYAKDEHRQRGEAVHRACDLACEGRYREEGTHAVVIPYIRAFQKFLRDTGFKKMGGEVPMGSVALGYAGRPDAWGLVGDRMVLCDFKSGTTPSGVGLQLAAYALLMKEQDAQNRILVDSLRVVQLGDDERYKVMAFDEPKWKNGWRAVLSTYLLRKELGKLPKEN